ncbi:nuclear transport factor 2 family protein [Micromonospora sp. NPDC023633]|uniref:nuclear transport factor 2 family protein n=1 Tax=Micromonospora sp. NPDC023633 TaxID=3154320 RepID=UPI0033CA7256
MTDRAEIAELVARLARALDERRFEDLRAIYPPDAATSSPRGDLRGIDDIVDVVRRTSPQEEATQHFNTDVVVDLGGDRADVSTHQLVCFFRGGQTPHRTAGVRARYTAVRTRSAGASRRLRSHRVGNTSRSRRAPGADRRHRRCERLRGDVRQPCRSVRRRRACVRAGRCHSRRGLA